MTRTADLGSAMGVRSRPHALALAIDAGNSKTDALVVRSTGEIVARARGGGFRPQIDGVDAAMELLSTVIASLPRDGVGPVDLVSAYLAGADLPEEEAVLRARLGAAGWGARVVVGNDTMALLRSGAPERWGVAVVCGAGINAVGRGPDGAVARFPALGDITGDWGGGEGLARTALWSAVRGEDGRGPTTALSAAIASLVDRPTALDVGLSLHLGTVHWHDLRAVTPVLFEVAAAGDEVASAIVARLAAEIAGLATVLVGRLGLGDTEVPLVLGGGVLAARHAQLEAALDDEIRARGLRVALRVPQVPPVFGAALLALDELGAEPSAERVLLAG